MQIPVEKPGNYYDKCQTTSLLIHAEVSKLLIEGRGEIVRCHLYGQTS